MMVFWCLRVFGLRPRREIAVKPDVAPSSLLHDATSLDELQPSNANAMRASSIYFLISGYVRLAQVCVAGLPNHPSRDSFAQPMPALVNDGQLTSFEA